MVPVRYLTEIFFVFKKTLVWCLDIFISYLKVRYRTVLYNLDKNVTIRYEGRQT